MIALLTQAINLFASILLILAFAMITQRRVLNLVHLFTAQGLTLVAATLDVGYLTAQPHLYVSAGATFLLKVVVLPILLHKLINRLQVRWDVEPLLNTPLTMLVGIVLITREIGTSRRSLTFEVDRVTLLPAAVTETWAEGTVHA